MDRNEGDGYAQIAAMKPPPPRHKNALNPARDDGPPRSPRWRACKGCACAIASL